MPSAARALSLRSATFTLIVTLLALSVPASGLSAAPVSEGRNNGDLHDAVAAPKDKEGVSKKEIKEVSYHRFQIGLARMNRQLTALVRSDLFGIIYVSAILVLVLVTIFIFWNRGFFVCSGILMYLLSMSTMTLTIKAVYVRQAYTYPKLVSAIHFMLSGMACFAYLAYLRRGSGVPITVPSLQQAMLIVPLAFSFAASIGASNSALVYANASFVEMINSCMPFSTAVVCAICGMGFDLRLALPVMVVTGGMALCAIGEMEFSWIGFAFSLSACFIRSFKGALQQKIMAPSDESQHATLRPAELLAWMSIPSTAFMLGWSFLSEGSSPYPPLLGKNGLAIAAAIAVTCVNAVCLNLAQFFVVQHLGAVGTNIAANLKGVLLLLGSVAIFGDVITLSQIFGFALQILGIFWFNKTDQDIKAAAAAQKEKENGSKDEKAPLLSSRKQIA